MNKGDSKKALEYLLPVTERDPENVAALALLADAYLLDAAWTSYEKTAKRLKPLPVRTAEETLLKARALRIIGDRVPIMRHQQFSTTDAITSPIVPPTKPNASPRCSRKLGTPMRTVPNKTHEKTTYSICRKSLYSLEYQRRDSNPHIRNGYWILNPKTTSR